MTYVDVDGPRDVQLVLGRPEPAGGCVGAVGRAVLGRRHRGGPRRSRGAEPRGLQQVSLRAPRAGGYAPSPRRPRHERDPLQRLRRGYGPGPGGRGRYTVANVQSGTGEDRYAAWDLIVVYRDSTQPPRNLTVFDGLATVSRATPTASMSLSGFITPADGPVRSTVGLWSSEGDRTSTGDSATLELDADQRPRQPGEQRLQLLDHPLRRRCDGQEPDYDNQLGSDMNLFREDGVLANGATSATVRLTTGGETYYPAGVFFTTDIFAPEIRPAKSVVDLNGGATERGDQLEYTVRLTNGGQDPAVGHAALDPIPAQSSYVPEQPRGDSGPTTAGACGAFVAPVRRPRLRPGRVRPRRGPDRLPAGHRRDRHRRAAAQPSGPSARASGSRSPATRRGERDRQPGAMRASSGSRSARSSLRSRPTPSRRRLRRRPRGDQDPRRRGLRRRRHYDFTIGVANAGDVPTSGTVTVTDGFDRPVLLGQRGRGAGWMCSLVGGAVTCTRSDALPAGQAYPPIAVNATVEDPVPATVSTPRPSPAAATSTTRTTRRPTRAARRQPT